MLSEWLAYQLGKRAARAENRWPRHSSSYTPDQIALARLVAWIVIACFLFVGVMTLL